MEEITAQKDQLEAGVRSRVIVRTSVIGIAANVLLAAFKAVIGFASNSIAITMDAVNNLSDVLSSVITIVGTKLAERKPDREHPYGFGRIEYLSSTIISVIVLHAGVTSLVESVKRILAPEVPDCSPAALVIIAGAVAVKLLLGRYVRATGERVRSDSLVASGADALFDTVLSLSTLVAAVVFLVAGVAIESWVGTLISVFIVKGGLEMLGGTINQILGERADAELAREVKRVVAADPDANGAFDLELHAYGPEQIVGSVHTEVPDTLSAGEIDEMSRRIQDTVYAATDGRVLIAAVGIYSRNTTDSTAKQMRSDITRMVMAHEGVLQLHGFYVDEAARELRFDVILDFALPDREATFRQIRTEVQVAYPDFTLKTFLDADVTD